MNAPHQVSPVRIDNVLSVLVIVATVASESGRAVLAPRHVVAGARAHRGVETLGAGVVAVVVDTALRVADADVIAGDDAATT